MAKSDRTVWRYGNQHNEFDACGYCQGTAHHEPWCATVNPGMNYVYDIVDDARKLTQWDALVLHSLGVKWRENPVR